MKPSILGIGLLAASALATHESVLAQSPTRPCESNFSAQGSLFSGKQYKTWQEHSGVEYDSAFRKVAQAVASSGWASVTPNKDLGIISASQSVTMGKGSVAPLNIVVQEKSSIIRVEVIFSTSAGQMASEDVARTQLCKIVESPSM